MNIENSRRRRQWPFFAALFALALIFFLADSFGRIGNGAGGIRSPLVAFASLFSRMRDMVQRPQDLQAAQLEIQALQMQIDQLSLENEEMKGLQAEYERLAELLNYTNSTPQLTRVTAKVIGRGSNPAFQDLIIDKGIQDGVRVGMPVESPRGLVGQVYRTSADSAQILLLTDLNSRIPSRLTEARSTGVVSRAGIGNLLVMDWIDLEANLQIGETVVTAGIDGNSPQELIANRFPPNIVIGRVIELRGGQSELFQQAVIESAVDFDALEMVLVVTNFAPADPTVFEPTPAP